MINDVFPYDLKLTSNYIYIYSEYSYILFLDVDGYVIPHSNVSFLKISSLSFLVSFPLLPDKDLFYAYMRFLGKGTVCTKEMHPLSAGQNYEYMSKTDSQTVFHSKTI